MTQFPELEHVGVAQRRVCRSCEAIYTISKALEGQEDYFRPPHDYVRGCQEYCLACWLGVGPLDIPEAYGEEPFVADPPNQESDEAAEEGDLVARYRRYLNDGCHLVVMPISRVHIEWSPITYRDLVTFFPPGCADLDALNIVENSADSGSLAEACSALSGITEELLCELPLVVFPCRLNWQTLRQAGHNEHEEMIRTLAESVDRSCLNFIRFKLCRIDLPDTLPGRAGQTNHPMMDGACIYNHSLCEARIIGGDVHSHLITRGLGLSLDSIEVGDFPKEGEVGNIVEHALGMYSAIQEADSPTTKFMLITNLFEYLAFPDEFRPLKKVRAVVVRYAARTPQQREQLTNRFKNDFFGLDGYRTRIVHKGQRLEQILPSPQQRKALFGELEGYLHRMIDDMVRHSELSWSEFLDHRKTIGLPPLEEDSGFEGEQREN